MDQRGHAPAGPQWLIRQVDGRMIVFSDTGFHAAEGDPSNLKVCQRGEWEERRLVETVLSMLTLVCHLKKVVHHGCFQCPGPVAWFATQRVWFRAPLDS